MKKNFVERMRSWREANGYGRERFAVALGNAAGRSIHPTTIQKIERGERNVMTWMVIAFANLSGLPVNELLEAAGEQPISEAAMA